jgi:hypothetical protein
MPRMKTRPKDVSKSGVAIVLNRPALLLRHTSNKALQLPSCLQGVDLLEFTGETTLKKTLANRLPRWVEAPPDRDWFNRFCIFGNRVCRQREKHPRLESWGSGSLSCHVSDGLDTSQAVLQQSEREEIRSAFEDVVERYNDLLFSYLEDLSITDGYQFLLCSHCQLIRSTPFAVYHLLPQTPADVYIAIGMNIAVEKLFGYTIPKIFLVRREEDLPSLLRGYEVVQATNSSEVKRRLTASLPPVIHKVRETAWKPRPLPFIECVLIQDVLPEQSISNAVPSADIFRNKIFVGREMEVAQILNSLAAINPPKIISIIGPAGIGKTTLAREIVFHAIRNNMFPDGIFWADRDPDVRLILSTWIKKITGEETTPTIKLQELIDTWNTIIRNKRVLIVVDDIESARIDFEVLLPKPLNCAVLLISRSVGYINESGIRVVVSPLTQAASAELLRKHLVEAGRENALTFNELTQLATTAEGSPLILSRVAQMLNTMSAEQIVNELNRANGGTSNPLDSIRRWIDGEVSGDTLAEVGEQSRPRHVWEEFLVKVAREVEAVMQREMFTPPGGMTFIPPEYVVYLSSDDDKEWQGEKRRGLEQGLYHVLSERARELSAQTQLATKSFAVELRVDGTLSGGEFRVQPVWEAAENVHEARDGEALSFISKLPKQVQLEATALVRLISSSTVSDRQIAHTNGLFELRGESVRIFYKFSSDNQPIIIDSLLNEQGEDYLNMIKRKAEMI